MVPNYRPHVLFIQTWRWKRVDLFVGDRHNRVVEFLQKFWDGLVGQEPCHRSQHQVDDDEHHSEEILHTVFTDSPRCTASLEVILCNESRGGKCMEVNLTLKAQDIACVVIVGQIT